MATTNHTNSIWNTPPPKRRFWDIFFFWKAPAKQKAKIPTPNHITKRCKGLELHGKKIKTILYSTDLALIENNDADALLAVYPFTPSLHIIKTLIAFSNKPVICGIGGGMTQGDFAIEIALEAQKCGAAAVIVNQPFKNEDIAILKQHLTIPIISSISTLNFDFEARIQAGVSCFNITGGGNTIQIVEYLQQHYPDFPVISTGGKTYDSLQNIVNKKVSAVILTPPSNAELFRSIMDNYRKT
ncbi:hypothetical protein [Myroides sp. DF42-4-2]|uniref:hypothetical protein n=1 Tax=unclassified Myroides TaxID=2642485 RepID=UPI0025786CB8|nr:hypothetical protein [Myroides sp. DF42-4-2]MDM1408291.1 hypothetical protein [Myroides sp. DF42-4-2]